MLVTSIIAIIISFISLSVTIINVYKNWRKSRFNLSVEVKQCFFIPSNGYYAQFEIINNSSEPISITALKINEIFGNSNAETIIKTNNETTLKTAQLPIRIESYGAVCFFSHFAKNPKTFIEGLDIEIRTSRGISLIHKKDIPLLSIAELPTNIRKN
ncbi:hypothetical protein ACTFIB_11255 [Staphylococcus chromogenes]|uniref:hypothetical protein n=1 Tax=Staphylococcus TaxID=1279 RepID=UPI000D1CDEF6|nr:MULTISPECIES: hypothetical protein [Staphylococcus]MDP4460408.1 hypothetical protein [Staphylococcus hyicus]MDU0452320.1 hypothetical protein [Staphylococcus chromogenes]PTF68573.1 hypothetical protein BUY03_09350 [Staphylococcus chromogenes]